MRKIDKILKYAHKHLGKPYKYGAKMYEAPRFFDCSSLVKYLYGLVDVELPRSALLQASKGKNVKKKNQLQPGDLIFVKGRWGHYNPEFLDGIGHVLLYVGEDKVIHALSNEVKGKEKGQVILENAHKWLERKDLVTIKRII